MLDGTLGCSIPGCIRSKVLARGWCAAHYQRWKKYGEPTAGPPIRRVRGSLPPLCKLDDCERDATSLGWCELHYRRFLHNGDPLKVLSRTPYTIHRYEFPPDEELLSIMANVGTYTGVLTRLGISKPTLLRYLRRRPELRQSMAAAHRPKQTPEMRRELGRISGREWQRNYRKNYPNEARRKRREHMSRYGPEYRHRWNHYNRLRRLGAADLPDADSREYALILRSDPCCYCGRTMGHIDHIHPVALGGDGSWQNLTAACASCNLSKNARPLLTFLLNSMETSLARVAADRL